MKTEDNIKGFDIKNFVELEIQEPEPEVNINECFTLIFSDLKDKQIELYLDYETLLSLYTELNKLNFNK